jgi:N-acyl-D-amino-acid deacylase
VIEICRPLAAHHGLYCTHMRNEADHIIDSLEETFRIGRECGVPVVISHHKLVGVRNYGRSPETLKLIAKQMALQPICLDCYPYPASSTILSAHRAVNATRVTVTWSKPLPQYAGRDLVDIAKEMGVSQEEAVNRLSPAGAIYYMMDDADVQRILQFGPTMIGSDGLPHDAAPHPRLWASFPRVLGHYGRSLAVLAGNRHPQDERADGHFGLRIVAKCARRVADLTLLDPDTVNEAPPSPSDRAGHRHRHRDRQRQIVNGDAHRRDRTRVGA